MDDLYAVAFQIISAVGAARSSYIEAIGCAKKGDFDGAQSMMNDGNALFLQGHHAHTGLIQQEASGEPLVMNLILTHAEDQLMSAEGFRIIAQEFIDVYRQVKTN